MYISIPRKYCYDDYFPPLSLPFSHFIRSGLKTGKWEKIWSLKKNPSRGVRNWTWKGFRHGKDFKAKSVHTRTCVSASFYSMLLLFFFWSGLTGRPWADKQTTHQTPFGMMKTSFAENEAAVRRLFWKQYILAKKFPGSINSDLVF